MEKRGDYENADMLRAHIEEAGSVVASGMRSEGYNGTLIYHFMCKYYRWTPFVCNDMDYAMFFGMFREAQLSIEREQEEIEKSKSDNNNVIESDGSNLEHYIARPREYGSG